MYRPHFTTFLLTVLALVASFVICSGNNGTNPQTGDDSTMEELSPQEKGMQPIYKLLHGFLETVMPHNFYSQDESPFSVQDLDEVIKKSNYKKLQDDWQDLFKTFGGFAACFILGLLFVISFPIIAFCFCCCFCCCKNCGGAKGRYDPKRASCMRVMCATLLLVFATLMLAGGIVTFLGAELLHKSLKNENNDGILGRIDTSLNNLQKFSTSTTKDLKSRTETLVGNGLTSIRQEIEDTANKTVVKVKATVNATYLLDEAEDLGKAALLINDDLISINVSVRKLKALQTDVTTKLNDINNTIVTSCASVPGGCSSVDTSSLSFNPDFSGLSELEAQAGNIANTTQITTYINDAKDKFNDVSDKVDAEVAKNINDSKDRIDEINTQLTSELSRVDNATVPFNKSMQEGKDYISSHQKDIAQVADYIWYACIGLGCTILLPVFFYYMGVLFGICGERPGRTAACCNRGTGANLLYAGVYFSSLFSWIVMLFVALSFLVGGLGYTMVCRYINDGVENVAVFETVVQDSVGWNVSQAFGVEDLSISGMFQNCKDNQAIYTALHFDSLFDLDSIVNVTDIKNQVSDMASVSVSLDNITLMSTKLEGELNEFLDADLANIPFDDYTQQLEKDLIATDLSRLIGELESAAEAAITAGDTTNANKLNESAQDLQTLQDKELKEIKAEMANLSRAIGHLKMHANLTHKVQSLINGIKNSEKSYNDQKEQIVDDSLKEATRNINNLIENTVTSAKDMIKNDVGKCRPLYDAAQSVVDAGCGLGLQNFNSIWFGLGWAAFFYIPCFICAAVLAAYYMKIGSHRDNPKHDFDDPNHEAYNGYMGSHQDNIPLTSQQMQDRVNGKYNGGYDRNEGSAVEYRRDPQSSGYGYEPYNGHGSGYRYEGGGYRSESPPRPPPDYDDLPMQDYPGSYPKSYNY